jgi:nucleotide-binding universal stress UspA family protein
MSEPSSDGPVLFAFDGSEHAKAAIEAAGEQLWTGREALVLTVWEPLQSVPFWGSPTAVVPQDISAEVVERADEVAQQGAELATAAGFAAEPLVEGGSPVWSRITEVAEERDAAIVVLGSHGRSGVAYALMGSVATAVAHNSRRPVMIIRGPSD